jgi:hypothetical protein
MKITAAEWKGMFPNKPMRRHKYGARKTLVDSEAFDSKLEADRYQILRLRYMAGEITALERQVTFELKGALGQHVCNYIADFRYLESGTIVVEDAKGFRTPVYKLKRSLFLQTYPRIVFREVETAQGKVRQYPPLRKEDFKDIKRRRAA